MLLAHDHPESLEQEPDTSRSEALRDAALCWRRANAICSYVKRFLGMASGPPSKCKIMKNLTFRMDQEMGRTSRNYRPVKRAQVAGLGKGGARRFCWSLITLTNSSVLHDPARVRRSLGRLCAREH